MDASNRQLTLLLDKTDSAFQQLLKHPLSSEYSTAYEQAKSELDCYVHSLRDELKRKYKDW